MSTRNILKYAGLAVFGFVAMAVIFGSFYTIDQRSRGVVLRNGAVIGEADPGLHFKAPMVDSVIDVSIETRVVKYEKLQAYSRDQQDADLRLSVIFRVPASGVTDLYSRFGTIDKMVERVISPKVMEQVKNVFGGYNAVTAIQERGRLNADIAAAVHAGIKSLDAPAVIEAVQIENIDFSDAYEKSIEQRMLAEVEVQKLRQNAEREKVQADIVVTQATAKANAVRQQAQAESEAIKLRGDAEAQAIRARAAALGDNPNLVALTQAERWDGKLPATMIPGGAVPMLSVGR